MFFAQRCFVVAIIVLNRDFGLQWSAIQIVLLLNTVYLFASGPYLNLNDGIPDYFNTVMLLLLSVWQITFSAWLPNCTQRYLNGLVFDCLIALSFILNLGYVSGIVLKQIILYAKRAQYRYKVK
jgi:hypothetical protein